MSQIIIIDNLEKYVFVDGENANNPKVLAQLLNDHNFINSNTQILLMMGTNNNQSNYDEDVRKAIEPFITNNNAPRIRQSQTKVVAKDSLDVYLLIHLGYAMFTYPDAEFFIISNDHIFDNVPNNFKKFKVKRLPINNQETKISNVETTKASPKPEIIQTSSNSTLNFNKTIEETSESNKENIKLNKSSELTYNDQTLNEIIEWFEQKINNNKGLPTTTEKLKNVIKCSLLHHHGDNELINKYYENTLKYLQNNEKIVIIDKKINFKSSNKLEPDNKTTLVNEELKEVNLETSKVIQTNVDNFIKYLEERISSNDSLPSTIAKLNNVIKSNVFHNDCSNTDIESFSNNTLKILSSKNLITINQNSLTWLTKNHSANVSKKPKTNTIQNNTNELLTNQISEETCKQIIEWINTRIKNNQGIPSTPEKLRNVINNTILKRQGSKELVVLYYNRTVANLIQNKIIAFSDGHFSIPKKEQGKNTAISEIIDPEIFNNIVTYLESHTLNLPNSIKSLTNIVKSITQNSQPKLSESLVSNYTKELIEHFSKSGKVLVIENKLNWKTKDKLLKELPKISQPNGYINKIIPFVLKRPIKHRPTKIDKMAAFIKGCMFPKITLNESQGLATKAIDTFLKNGIIAVNDNKITWNK
ncbi:MAG: hypothetical protein SPK04_05445 [Succinivibrionaceae bacterium]|nr:hypothetical protein [Succinivibrionaceae bacterium]